ncbi:hypothetical protein SAMN04515656_1146 [Eubacterium aggregans]|uniref:Uncharacterized protein n=1 Tax=Eubacterium aggregans TaxID=81409 RepID=A0A1H4C6P4_9FIRM|nr:hypothetical protein SAMN04515656_1146 [Eubacterium aggregans]
MLSLRLLADSDMECPKIPRVSVDCIPGTATLRRTGAACTTSGNMTVIQSANSRPITTTSSGQTPLTFTLTQRLPRLLRSFFTT